MPELRTDWLIGRTVLVAEGRADRPNEFVGEAASAAGLAASSSSICPFCAGHESQTPPAVYEPTDAEGCWRVRVVPNKYPAVTVEDDSLRTAEAVLADGPLGKNERALDNALPAFGAHEVIIESPRHVERVSALSVAELSDVLAAYAARLCHWRDDGRFRYGLVFKNQGPQAGASLAHVHSQLIALPDLPPRAEQEFTRAGRRFEQQRTCPSCDLIERERSCRRRIVLDRDGYIAFCPFASLQPMEVWLMPTGHEASFERAMEAQACDRLAGVLHALIGSLEAAVPSAAYHLLVRTAPWHADANSGAWCHWRIELLPRVAALAGLELGAAVHINPLPPERAARRLREELGRQVKL